MTRLILTSSFALLSSIMIYYFLSKSHNDVENHWRYIVNPSLKLTMYVEQTFEWIMPAPYNYTLSGYVNHYISLFYMRFVFGFTSLAFGNLTLLSHLWHNVAVERVKLDDINILTFTPIDNNAHVNRGCVVFIHGGGWMHGSPEEYTFITSYIALKTQSVVASIGYRKSPFYFFPIPVEDSVNGIKWVIEHASQLQCDASKLTVAGDSAGGHLALVAAIKLKDEGIDIPYLNLVYPTVSLSGNEAPGRAEFAKDKSGLMHPFLVSGLLNRFAFGNTAYRHELIANKFTSVHLQTLFKCLLFTEENIITSESSPWNKTHQNCPSISHNQLTEDNTAAKDFEPLFLNPYFNPVAMNESQIVKLPYIYIVFCKDDPLRDHPKILQRIMKQFNKSIEIEERKCFHGSFTFFFSLSSGERLMDSLVISLNKIL